MDPGFAKREQTMASVGSEPINGVSGGAPIRVDGQLGITGLIWKLFVHFHTKEVSKVKDLNDVLTAMSEADWLQPWPQPVLLVSNVGGGHPVRPCLDPTVIQYKRMCLQELHLSIWLVTTCCKVLPVSCQLWLLLLSLTRKYLTWLQHLAVKPPTSVTVALCCLNLFENGLV